MTVWFVTGAGRGLGLEIARAALEAGEGVVVAAQAAATVPAAVADADRALVVPLDVTDDGSIAAAVERAAGHFGGIDVLVNNAGRGLMGAVEETSDLEARGVFDVNVFGLLDVTRFVLPHMRAAGGGTIVNIASLAGLHGLAGSAVYGATKAAVVALSEGLVEELRPFGVRCMVVEPGVFRTDFLDPISLRVVATPIGEYAGTPARDRVEGVAERNHRQLGDPARAAALIHDVVSAGDELPVHLPLGRDALEMVERKAGRLTADAARWRERSVATAHDDGGAR